MSNVALRKGAGAVVSIDLNALQFDKAMGALDRSIAKAGVKSGGGGKRIAPGDTYQYKKGWKKGVGKKAVSVEPPTFVVNVPHLGVFFQKFTEGDDGKYTVSNSDVCLPFSGAEIVDRESLGDNDTDDWGEYDNEPQDPWSFVMMFPVRTVDSTEYHNVQASSGRKVDGRTGEVVPTKQTNINQLRGLVNDFREAAKLQPGMLPVVRFGGKAFSKVIEQVDRKGKSQKKKMEWDALSAEIVDWVPAQACDRLNGSVDLGERVGEDGELPEATVSMRSVEAGAQPNPTMTAPKPRLGGKPAVAAETKAKPKKKKSAPADL